MRRTCPLLSAALSIDCGSPLATVLETTGAIGMTDERLIQRGLDDIEALIGLVFEEALESAVSRPPDDPAARQDRLAGLEQACADATALAGAAAVVLRRWQLLKR